MDLIGPFAVLGIIFMVAVIAFWRFGGDRPVPFEERLNAGLREPSSTGREMKESRDVDGGPSRGLRMTITLNDNEKHDRG